MKLYCKICKGLFGTHNELRHELKRAYENLFKTAEMLQGTEETTTHELTDEFDGVKRLKSK